MSVFDPAVFGMAFHRFVTQESEMLGFLSPWLHVITVIVLALIFIRSNRAGRFFIIYFTLQWAFLFGYWGVYGIIYWAKEGLVYLAAFIASPILLAFILWQWIREIFRPSLNMDFQSAAPWRWIVLIILAWGFWYPAYVWGEGFIFQARDLLYSNYGLMPCPTTMVILSLLSLSYPRTNRVLFNLLAAYAVFIGSGSVLAGWLPDIPFVVLGLYCFGLSIINRIKPDIML